MSINEVRYLPECGSTNAYVKEHFEEFGPVGAVYTTNQTAGRGRLGRTWVNAEGKALYYTVAIREPLAQPATLPLLASLAVRRQLQLRYGVDCQIKWPNDLLLNGKKVVGILCESVSYGYQQQGRGILCGIGINLAQPQSYFDAADLPHGTSLALQGAAVDLAADPQWLAEGLTDFGFDRPMYVFAREGFAPFREEYKAACVNIGRRVTFDLPGGGQGVKTSAAWLIDHAGFHKGFKINENAPAGLSTLHTLALTNRGGASAEDIARLAKPVQDGVEAAFGIRLVPEPVVIGMNLK